MILNDLKEKKTSEHFKSDLSSVKFFNNYKFVTERQFV